MKLRENPPGQGPVTAVVASSAGNHAQGVAFAAKTAGIAATIVMPRSAPMAKVSATQGYGATVELYGVIYDDAYNRALAIQEETGATFIHPFDDDDVIAGQATIGLEILRDLPGVDMIFVPTGGGGLLSGIAACVKQVNPRVKIIGVQAAGAQNIVRSFRAKTLMIDERLHTIADGIAVKTPGSRTLKLITSYVDDMVTVTDSEIAATILMLLERSKQVVEPAGAVSLAAALNNKLDIAGKKIVCLLSGGNIDVSFIHRVVEKGLLNRGRSMKFQTVMRDVPGSLEKFASIVAGNNANITMVQHDRLKADLDIDEAILHIVCEVGGFEHGRQVISGLEREGYRVIMESEENYTGENS